MNKKITKNEALNLLFPTNNETNPNVKSKPDYLDEYGNFVIPSQVKLEEPNKAGFLPNIF